MKTPFPLTLVIPLRPLGKQIHREAKNITPKSKKIKDLERVVKHNAARGMENNEPTWADISLRIYFYRDVRARVNLTNLVQLVEDSMEGIVYHNNSQIVSLQAIKAYSKEVPRAEIHIDIYT